MVGQMSHKAKNKKLQKKKTIRFDANKYYSF